MFAFGIVGIARIITAVIALTRDFSFLIRRAVGGKIIFFIRIRRVRRIFRQTVMLIIVRVRLVVIGAF